MMESARTLLVVEDDANDVLFLKRAFEKCAPGLKFRVATDGEKAVAYLLRQAPYEDGSAHPLPSIILLDLKLPRKSGFEVLSWMKSRKDIHQIPVVVLTSSTQDVDIDRAYSLGVNSYLVKPVDFEGLTELAKTVKEYWVSLNRPPTPALNRLESKDSGTAP